MERGRIATRVVADRVDLIGRDVEAIAALVLEQQVVAVDPVEGARDHPAVATDAVRVVHDVVTGLQVFEERDRVAALRPRPAVRASPTGEVGLGDDCEPGRGQHEPVIERRDDDVAASAGEVGRAGEVDSEVEADREQQVVKSLRGAVGVGGDDDAVALAEQLCDPPAEALAVADDRPPSGRFDDRGVRTVGHGEERPHAGWGVREQIVEGRVEARELGAFRPPRLAQAACEVGLLGQDLGGAVTHPPRLDEHDLRVGVEQVDEGVLAGCEPRHPRLHAVEHETFGESLPLLAAPRLGADQRGCAGAYVVGRQQLARREDLDLGEVRRRALVVDAELREAIHLVAPQVDAHGDIRGRRKHVDDRASQRHLAAVLDEVLTPVAEAHRARPRARPGQPAVRS